MINPRESISRGLTYKTCFSYTDKKEKEGFFMIKTTSEKAIYPDLATLKPDLQSALIIYPLYAGLHGELKSALFYFEQFFRLKEQKESEMCEVFFGILSSETKHLSYLYKTLYFLGLRPKINGSAQNVYTKKEILSQSFNEILLDALAMERWLTQTQIDGVYAENYGAIEFANRNRLKVFAGCGLHLCNALSVQTFLHQPNASYYALSKELNESEISKLVGEKSFVLAMGDIKLMDLCYCPFKKTCRDCDKRQTYTLTDENERVFPVRRYVGANGECRFEIYNCANLIGTGVKGVGKLLDLSITADKRTAITAKDSVELQKSLYKNYTAGHLKRGVL
jgi:hypothetical protein